MSPCFCLHLLTNPQSYLHFLSNYNNSNILCLGERITGLGLALDIVDIWLNTDFEGGRHQERLDLVSEIENENMK